MRFDDAEPIPGPTSEALARAAREHGVVVIGSIFERAPGLYHNTAVIYDADGRLAGMYRKMHIPDDPLYYEKFYFTPGDLGFSSFATRYGRLGACVCWDQWYPEAARLTALAGAMVVFYPTAIGWHPSEKAELGASQHSAWETMMRSHAIANGMFVAAVNRVASRKARILGRRSSPIPTATLARGSHDTEETPRGVQPDEIDGPHALAVLRDRRTTPMATS
jgi:N-carbamoylputrescine amidase